MIDCRLFLISALMCSLGTMARKPADVFIYAGQSNADGRAFVSSLPDYLKGGRPYRFKVMRSLKKLKINSNFFKMNSPLFILVKFAYIVLMKVCLLVCANGDLKSKKTILLIIDLHFRILFHKI